MGSTLSALEPATGCCTSRGGANESEGSGSVAFCSTDNLEDALASFNEKGLELLEKAGRSSKVAEWEAAYKLIFEIFVGAQRHLGKTIKMQGSVWVNDGSDSRSFVRPQRSASHQKMMTLTIKVAPAPISADVATRSHLGISLRLAEVVRFSLLSSDASSDPLALEVEGLSFELAPDILPLRQRVKRELGSDYTAENVYAWWNRNIDQACPLRDSKGRRTVHALFELRSFQLTVPHHFKVKIVWALVNATPTRLTRLEFAKEGKGDVCVTAAREKSSDPEEASDAQLSDEIIKEALLRDKSYGDAVAPSSFNFMRLLHGHNVGMNGASAAKLTKLLSAAHTWGCGTEGWQCWDDTWLAVDTHNVVGRKVCDNGRLIWREPQQ
eukprot:TRINITY_DN218_c1_g2_i1.p1 TRINITY_DN218_c1_g2~~TRINITY_DN218_c1_g2_i1.p1  ORF type:complete len:400 (-),score=46.69 TRINITY_DN218_c1_g2_i1:432-1577(-)